MIVKNGEWVGITMFRMSVIFHLKQDVDKARGRIFVFDISFFIVIICQLQRSDPFPIFFVSMGIVHTTGTQYEVYSTGSAKAYRKVVFSPDGNRLVGVLFVGDIARAGLYRLVIRERIDVAQIKSHIINHSLHYGHFIKT